MRNTFQLTRSRGARLYDEVIDQQIGDFNSRAHVERDEKIRPYEPNVVNFNSRAHVERDKVFEVIMS